MVVDPINKDIYLRGISEYRYAKIPHVNVYFPNAITYDPKNMELYWTDTRFRRIIVSSVNGSIKRIIKQFNRYNNPKGIALDVLSRVLFYTDTNNRIIAALSLDGSMHKIVITNSSVQQFAIDPIHGTIYWTASEPFGKIEKSNYDGTNRQVLIDSGLAYTTGLTINILAGLLYWCNYSTIERSNVDGTNRQLIYQQQDAYIHGIALYHSSLYITGYMQYRYYMMRIGTDGSNPVIFGPSDVEYTPYIYVHTNQALTLGSNACFGRNGNCSHFCFPRTGGLYVCGCPDGLVLRSDGHTCRSYIGPCDDLPCQNSGICTNTKDSYFCNCSRGWQGETCSTGISFEFGEYTNDTVLMANDDACGEQVTLLPMPIFGRKYDTLYVCTNGLVSFQNDYTNPNPSADVDAYPGHFFLAPYYTDLDTSGANTSGKVYYQLYDVLRNKDLVNNTNVLQTQRLLNEVDEEPNFKATMIFVVTWYKNSPYPNVKRSNESATFQLVLATDGYNTFVMYIYFAGEMRLQQNNVFIGYHFHSGAFKRHIISFTSQAYNIDSYVDANGLKGLIVYRLTSLGSSLSNFDIQCLEWFETNQDSQGEYNRKQAEMPNCPCNIRWIMYDPWFRVQKQIFITDVNTSCTVMAPSLKFSPHGKVCCFDNYTGAWLSQPPIAGGFLKFHPSTRTKEFESEDLRMRQICCELSNYCHLYYALRPIGDCYTKFPYEFALTWGDPHIKTLDSKTYTFNGWGEFTLISLQTENTSFVLQGRTDKARSKHGTLSDATIFTAFAARDNNNASIHVEISAEKNGTYVYGNGVDYSVALANIEKDFDVSMETLTIVRAKETHTLNILFPSTGHPISLNVSVGAEMLNLAVTLPPNLKNTTKGLLGNYDGDPNNDFIYPNGTFLEGNATERTLFNYGISWAIQDSESVFIYPNGTSHADFDHRNFTPKFSDEASQEQLRAASVHCGTNSECTYDFIMTNSELVAANTKSMQENAEKDKKGVSNQIPTLRFEGNRKINISDDRRVTLTFIAIDEGPVTFQFDKYTVGAEFVYTDDNRAEVNVTLGGDYQCELSVTAKDKQGFFAPSIRYDLIYCDGCSGHGTCDLDSYQTENETCSIRKLKCICEPYWEGSSCQLDFDGCRGSPCSLNRSCTDVDANLHKTSGEAFKCSQCPPGYLKDGYKCSDIDECNKTSDKCNQKCVNTEGSFFCKCEEGFALSTDGRTCEDIDECESNIDNCDQNCTNKDGHFTCGCFPGFEVNISTNVCILTEFPDACNSSTINCRQTAGCTSNNGVPMCFCAKGFHLSNNGTKCLDVDECTSSPCSQICNNFHGGFSCHCFQGYELANDKRTCVECKYPKYGNYCQETCNCGKHGLQCDHVKGCRCENGWEGYDCQKDINECTQTPNICVDPYSLCKNLPGTYTCECVDGFKKSETGVCQDVDECSDPKLNKCSQLCINSLAGFTCGCHKGYQLDQANQYKCIDVDECNIGTAGCEQICENVPGQYNCYCYYGYKLRSDRKSCMKEADVCSKVGNNTCSQICLVEYGKAACVCQQGYFLDTDGKTCKDINECETNTSCSQKDNCVNVNGSFSCSCNDGYRLDNDGVTCRECDAFHFGKNCNRSCNCGIGALRCDKLEGCICKPGWQGPNCTTDINECLLNKSICPGAHRTCNNTQGSYLCMCENGYIKENNSTVDCTDLNECDDSHLNTCDQNCTNTAGSYSCACNEGFKLQENRCIDVNECEGPNMCQHICKNLQGSYRCLCYTGFKIDVDNTTQCKPITECLQNETEVCTTKGAQCAIINGKAMCRCGKGLEWNNVEQICIDVKDCNPNARCNQICIEQIGGYTCACWEGHRLLQNNVTCVACDNDTYSSGCKNICQCAHNNAVNKTQTCDHVNGSCICKPGWEGRCDIDIDECMRFPRICIGIPNSGCHNTIGGYECSCLRGYVRQNNRCIQDSIPASPSPPQADETVAVMSIKLNVPLASGVNFNVTATYEYYSNAAKDALVQFYSRWLMDKLKRIAILSLASGSLIVDYNIYIFKSPDVIANFTLANGDLASGATVLFQNSSVGVLELRAGGILVPQNPSDEQLCMLFHLSYPTCSNGYVCKVVDGRPSCSAFGKGVDYLTTALAVGIPIALLTIGTVIVCICVIKRRRRTDRRAQDNSRGTLNEMTSTREAVENKMYATTPDKTNSPTASTLSSNYDLHDDNDEETTVSVWQTNAMELAQNEKFRTNRPKLE